MKFLHTADWQIGMKGIHVGKAGATVRAERLEAGRRVVQAAKENHAHFVLVAGDTFEDNAVDRLLVQKVGDILADFPGPVFLLPGNHDPLVPGSVWEHPVWQSHENLHVLRTNEPQEAPAALLLPSPARQKHSAIDPTAQIDARQFSSICVGAAHGTVEGVQQDELDYPIARDAAERCRVDYLALGHWHSTSLYPPGCYARMAYSGTHETTKFGERDSGNVLLVEIAERGASPQVTPIRTGGLTWRTLETTITEPGALGRVREEVEQIPNPRHTLLNVQLSGVLHAEDRAEVGRIEEIIESRLLYGRVDASQLLPLPTDDRWLVDIPAGVLRDVAEQLRELADPSFAGHRPDNTPPEVAAHALLVLYSLLDNA